jgi:clan AA aspartic protease
MGDVLAEITLKNGGDLVRVRDGHISEQNIRSVTVTALVDTGARTLIINEVLREKLGLAVVNKFDASLAVGSKTPCSVTEPVQIYWNGRSSSVQAWVLPNEDEILLGVIPLEEMDLIVDPSNRRLIGAHGDTMTGRIK